MTFRPLSGEKKVWGESTGTAVHKLIWIKWIYEHRKPALLPELAVFEFFFPFLTGTLITSRHYRTSPSFRSYRATKFIIHGVFSCYGMRKKKIDNSSANSIKLLLQPFFRIRRSAARSLSLGRSWKPARRRRPVFPILEVASSFVAEHYWIRSSKSSMLRVAREERTSCANLGGTILYVYNWREKNLIWLTCFHR